MTLLACLIIALAIPYQQPTATFEGTVVDSVTGQSIAGAHVTISSNLYGAPESARLTAPPAQQSTSIRRRLETPPSNPSPALPSITVRDVYTDAQGRFTIENVPPVAYTIGTAAAGYVFQIYGQKTQFGGLTPVKLATGNGPTNRLVIRLDPAADVSGIICDEDRKPIARASVYLLETTYSVDGGARFYVNGESQTDDAGKFSMKGVAAGTYHLVAGVEQPLSRTVQPTEISAWTFFPGVMDGGLAAKIDVLPGGLVNIGTLALQKQEARAIRGRVLDSRTGKPPATARFSLIRRYPVDRAGRYSEEPVRSSASYDAATGAFEFSNLPSGRYRLDVNLPAPPNAPAATPAASSILNVPQDAFTMVNIEKTDVNDIALTVPSASTLRAKIVIAGTDPLSVFDKTSAARPQFRLIPTQPLQPSSGFILLATTDGTFEVRSAFEGKYRVSLGPLGENHYVSELRLDGVRAPNNMIEVQPNAVAELVLVVRPDGGRVEGMVVDDKNQPVAGVRGILLPDPVPDVIGSYYPISSNPDGNFTLRGVAPGNYRAFVWSGLGELQLFDRELWTRTRGSATAIRVDVGSRITANIKVITP